MMKQTDESILIREIRPSEFPLMEDFMYEAIYHPDPKNPCPKAVIYYPQVRVYWDNLGNGTDDHCLLALMEDKPIGAVWIRTFQGELKGCGYIDEHRTDDEITLFDAV